MPEVAPARRLRVLVADDNRDHADTLALLLSGWGFVVRVAYDGEAAVAAAAQFRPQAAVLDIGMPRLDGYEVARRLRQGLPREALIAVTGYNSDEDRRRSQEAGFGHHLAKPLDPEQLQRLLEALSAGPAHPSTP